MAENYNVLEGTQTDINRRLLRRIIALEKANGNDTSELEAAIAALDERVKALEDAD